MPILSNWSINLVKKLSYFSISSSPSGCTFWGKKPWSRKKKILWQLGTLVGAPVGIALIAGIAVPAIIIGIPVYVGRKVGTVVSNWLVQCASSVWSHNQVHRCIYWSSVWFKGGTYASFTIMHAVKLILLLLFFFFIFL